jgi:putative N-acetyltransferase (TIGR04045 family)
VTPGFSCRIARTPAERDAYFRLRREIFCEEQQLFAGDDRDAVDEAAHPIVCVTDHGRVVGVVRLWEEAPGHWWGGRLGVHADFRAVGAIGRWLVEAAVGTAVAWGARRFSATVQRANVTFFRRLRWATIAELELHGRPHHLMDAELARYRPTSEARPGDDCASGAAEVPLGGAPRERVWEPSQGSQG